ncbi:MAG: FtsX-like permease family protein [Planctomycetota bacterium]
MRSDRRPGSRVLRVLALLAATAGCAAWFATRSLGDATVAATERVLAQGALPSLLFAGPPAALDEALRIARTTLPVRAELPRSWQRFTLEGDSPSAITLLATQMAQEVMAHGDRLTMRGSIPRDGEVAIDSGTAARLHREPGDALRLAGATEPLHVSGVLSGRDLLRELPAIGFVTFHTLARLRGEGTVDAIECALAQDIDPDAARGALLPRMPEGVTVRALGVRGEAMHAARALRTTVELAAWIALCLGLLATVASTRDTLRRRAPSLDLQRALGVSPRLVAMQCLLPAASLGGAAGAIGAVLGVALAHRLLPGLQAFASIQVGRGVLLPAPDLDAASLLSSLAIGATAAMLAAAFAMRTPRRTQRSHAAVALVALGGSLALARSGLTGLHPLLRALDVLLAALAAILLVGPTLALAARTLRDPFGRAWLWATPGSLLGALRMASLGIAFGSALLSIRGSLAAGIDDEALRRFPTATVLRDSIEVFGVDLGGPITLDGQRLRDTFHATAALGLDTVAQFVEILLALAATSIAAFTIAGVRERRDDFALLRDLGADPRLPRRLAARAWSIGSIAVAAVAAGIGALLGHAWTVGPLHDALGVGIAWQAAPWATLSCVIGCAMLVALVAATTAGRRLTAW